MNDFRRQQYEHAHDNAKFVYSTFLQWYIFFWGFNVAVLTWLTDKEKNGSAFFPPLFLAVFFLILNVLGVVTCLWCAKTIQKIQDDAVEIARKWTQPNEPQPETAFDLGSLPRMFGSRLFRICEVSLSLNVIAWAVYAWWSPKL